MNRTILAECAVCRSVELCKDDGEAPICHDQAACMRRRARARARRLYGALFDLYELATTDGEHPDRDAILDGARLVLREGRP